MKIIERFLREYSFLPVYLQCVSVRFFVGELTGFLGALIGHDVALEKCSADARRRGAHQSWIVVLDSIP